MNNYLYLGYFVILWSINYTRLYVNNVQCLKGPKAKYLIDLEL